MKRIDELKVGEEIIVTVDKVDLGYVTIDGIVCSVDGSEDLDEVPSEINSLDTYFVSDNAVYILGEDSEFPVANIKRIQ